MKKNDKNPLSESSISVRKQIRQTLLKRGALQNAILNSTIFSSIATDEKGIIQLFNLGAERMLGYPASEVVGKLTPADISDPQEIIARADALSLEFSNSIKPGFEALVFKAARKIEDIYELTYIRKNGSRFPAVVSVTALRDAQGEIIGYLLIGTDNTARKQTEAEHKQLNQRLRDQEFYTRSLIEVHGKTTVLSFDPLNYDFLPQIDSIVKHILRSSPERADNPEAVVVGFVDDNKVWQWYKFEIQSWGLKRTWLKDLFNDEMALSRISQTNIGYYNTEDDIDRSEY